MDSRLDRAAEVLVVGAGPTGLVLALWLSRLGVSVRVVDKASEPGTTSRALAVHARTLELYRQIGLADEVVEEGLRLGAINLWVRGKHAARAAVGDIGKSLSPFPYILMFPQDRHEKLLIEWLGRAGVEVERPVTLVDYQERDDGVIARLEAPDGAKAECRFAYIAGCDGAHSRVREILNVGYPGGTYERLFYVADVELRGPPANHELHVALDDVDLLAVFPLKGDHAARLIGTIPPDSEASHDKLTWDDVSFRAMDRLAMTVRRVHWFSTYRVHHRVASHFRGGRAFLAGDAAHVHSPVGGQGMNTGIGDAVNLAWKLAAVLGRRANGDLLDSYEPERKAFADRLVATTDRLFTFVSRDGFVARRVRLDAVPRIVPRLFESATVRRYLFRTVSQTLLNYRRSSLSEGRAGAVHGGDRLPWVPLSNGPGADNFAPLTSLDWQMHVYGEASAGIEATCRELGVALHVFAPSSFAQTADLPANAAYLVRPDGYVALADGSASPERLKKYFEHRGILMGTGRGQRL
jgi:2-polyprenyl-6-methoxyphenol hydroxylase-like FAD-dependent oxidoreductase